MPVTVADDAFGRYVKQTGMASAEQVESAVDYQQDCAKRGSPIALSEALVELGVITPTQRDTVMKRMQTQQQGAAQQLAHYLLLRKIGEGGMGTIYLAEDVLTRRQVAVKILNRRHGVNAEFMRRFQHEADAMGKLHHVNIVRAFSVGEDLGLQFYVMEYCEGESLDHRLKRDRFLPHELASRVALQVARALDYAHRHGIIHRDIKPSNIILLPDGTAKILDLGLSKSVDHPEDAFRTQKGVTMGTPYYMSPEQARGEKEIDGRADIYSLGATYYHLLTGEPPFSGSSAVEILAKHLAVRLTDPRDIRDEIPDGAVHVIQRMMAKKPGDRYRDCADLVSDLEQVVEGHTPRTKAIDASLTLIATPRLPRRRYDARATSPRQTARLKATRRQMAWLIGGCAGLALLVSLLVAGLSSPAKSAGPSPVSAPRPAAEKRPPASKPAPPPEPEAAPRDPVQATTDELRTIRENTARRLLGELVALEHERRLPPEPLIERVQGFAESYADTQAGRESAALIERLRKKHPPAAAVESGPDADLAHDAWSRRLEDLAGDEQVRRVVSRLRRLNPSFDGKEAHTLLDGQVDELTIPAPFITDITPVTALRRLRKLTCAGIWSSDSPRLLSRGRLEDLAPLRGTNLRSLDVSGTLVTDLAPLAGLRLNRLDISHNSVVSLAPLKGMPLIELGCAKTSVDDLSPIRNAPLQTLWFDVKPDRDTEILRAIPTLAMINGLAASEFWNRVLAGLVPDSVAPAPGAPEKPAPAALEVGQKNADGWICLFNGRDLTGWEKIPGTVPRVMNASIVLSDGAEVQCKVPAADFELKGMLEMRRGTASYQCGGVFIRRPGSNRVPPHVLFHTDGDAHLWGEGGKVEARSGSKSVPFAQWVPFLIRASGPSIRLTIQAKDVIRGTVSRTEPGHVALYSSDRGCVIAFRDLWLRDVDAASTQ